MDSNTLYHVKYGGYVTTPMRKTGQAPDEAGDQKQCILFNFHKKDSFLNVVHFEAKKYPARCKET